MLDFLIRASSLGKIMTEPTAAAAKAGEVLSAGAKTYLRQLAAQEIFSIDFEVSAKALEKGIRCEPDAIGLLNRVRGLSLTKNTERKKDGFVTGEADLVIPGKEGYDLKCSWSAATFPLVESDAMDAGYEWQMRAYMRLWNVNRWHVAYALVDTPDDLIGYEPMAMHIVGHIPEHMRLTVWTIERDMTLEAAIERKVTAARAYMRQVIAEFDRTHQPPGAAKATEPPPWTATPAPAPAPAAALVPSF